MVFSWCKSSVRDTIGSVDLHCVTRKHAVAHISTVHGADDNRILRKECVSLLEAGIDVCLIATHASNDVIDGVPVLALARRPGRLQRMVFGPIAVWRILRTVKPAVIHVHDPELIPFALLWRLFPGRSAIYDAHEDLAKQVMGKSYIPTPLRAAVAGFASLLERCADLGMDAVVVATPPIQRKFRNRRTLLLQNFPWLRAFPKPQDPMPETPSIVSYVGGITRERGIHEMIRAVAGSNCGAQLVLAGPATDDMLISMSESVEVGVHYLGRIPADQVPGVVAQSRIGLVLLYPLSNYLESQPTKLFEYMAAGRPFIASNFSYWKQLVDEFDCGYFIDPFDAELLSKTIDSLLNNPSRAAAMGRAGRRAVETKFSFEAEAPGLATLVKQLGDSR